MAKIGLDLRFWRSGTGGIGRYSRNLLVELLKIDKANQYTAIITPADEPEFNLQAQNLTKLVVDIPHFSFAEQLKLPSILKAQKFDLVHFANFNHPLLYRRPFVVTVHDIIMHLYPGSFQRGSFVHRQGYLRTFNDCRRADTVIVPSQSTKNDLVEKLRFPVGKIVVTPEGGEPKFTPQSAAKISELKNRLGLPDRYLLFVSRWERYKGLPALLEAHQQLVAKYPELGLVICGKPDAQNPGVTMLVEAAKKQNSRVITPGFVSDEDLVTLYSGAAVYVHPSWYEGFGIMILEAMAAGAPVVTSNVSSLPEVVGDAGLMVDPHSAFELTQAIEKVLADPALADRLRTNGFERVKNYSWAKMAEQTLDIYNDVLKRQP